MNLLKNKISIVTGGSRGIGASIVKRFVEEGSIVIFTYLKSTKEAKKISENEKFLGKIKSYQCDINNTKKNKNIVEKIIKKFGKIDILVNNVGITMDNLLIKMKEEEWNKVMHTNIYSVFNMTKNVIKQMIKQKNGSIINISSIIGQVGNIGQVNYAASKAAIIGFTKSLAKEVGSRNIRCNAVAPGFIITEMSKKISLLKSNKKKNEWIKKISLKRYGTTFEVANACVFLGSNLSSYVNGEILNVNGGMNF